MFGLVTITMFAVFGGGYGVITKVDIKHWKHPITSKM